ncbi:hypothetical protein SPRG_02920 [Saprolegnia parasitica CBS 223.65]|uniref:Vacuolar ATPase assembly protein VMA22 n=1 Tax=Saprolegnia parasitica (strain CBS 223.65) TaxID=695850 RepID=A0A067CPK3_SAPPC|nr:hypothetical protein SPRG_02920 [Saprolegnia parasitica CBS 223.65]KDO32443.1 hypothetical protein SPRG_02920 [Saprolegnia parasitica CBS 223.65]|eukprot:XP_012196894.1 hypothetical protein SPRG_02920 [Saprolegnia parasitica CBS 223.65]
MADEDERLLAAIEAAADYEEAAAASAEALRQAFFKLSFARRSLPPETLSSVAFRELFTADTAVLVSDTADYSIQKNVSWTATEAPVAEPTLRHRHAHATPAATPPASTVTTMPTPIFWFAPLPSHELRSAQQQFLKALTQVATTASRAATAQAALAAASH